MDIIIFGVGEEIKSAIPFLEQRYHILFLADNDEKKHGVIFENYIIKSIDEVKEYDCKIVITSRRYDFEISRQLQKLGVNSSRICFCRKLCTDCIDEYEVCPVEAEEMEDMQQPLIHYDLYCTEERETYNKKIMVCCTFFSTYTKQLIENMSKRCEKIEFSLLTRAKEYKQKITPGRLKHIYYFQTMEELKTILQQLPVYDAMQFLWIEWEWAYFYKLIREKAQRLNLNVGGSEFYRSWEDEKNFRRNLIACADKVTAETETTMREFSEYYKEETKDKMCILPFGIEVLEWIKYNENIPKNILREKYHIPSDKIVVTCGHNAICEHQHMKIIDAIERLPQIVKEQTVFVFPMTYPVGSETYIKTVNSRLEESGLTYIILTKFMDFKEMAEYAIVSDIMLHVQTTDQLSSTMLEEMYAGSVVMAGKWLPYRSLHKMGLFFLDIENIFDITASLEDVIVNLEEYRKKCEGNRAIIWKHSAWDELASRWCALWN